MQIFFVVFCVNEIAASSKTEQLKWIKINKHAFYKDNSAVFLRLYSNQIKTFHFMLLLFVKSKSFSNNKKKVFHASISIICKNILNFKY